MQKFTTIVRLALMIGLVLTQAVHAEDEKKSSNDSVSTRITLFCTKNTPSYNETQCDKAVKAADSVSGESYGCDGDFQGDYKKAKQEFVAACEEAGIAVGKEAGDIGCGLALAECKCFSGKLTTKEKSALCGNVESQTSRSSKAGGGIDMEAARRMFKYCPAMASADYKKNIEKLEKSDEKLEKMEEKIPALQDAAIKAKQAADEKQDTLDKEEAELDEKHEQDLADAKKNMSEEQKKIMEQMAATQAQMAALDEQIGQFDLAEVDAGNKRMETITQIELNCHAQAAAIVGKKQEEALALLRAGQLNLGGQKAMMKKVGLTDRQSWERVADRYYKWCLQSKPTIDSKASANRVFDSAISQAKKSKADLRNRKKLLAEQLVKMKDPNGGCGQVQISGDGSSNETEMCRSAREAFESQLRVENAYIRKKQGLNNQKARAAMAAEQNVRMKEKEALTAQNNLDNEKARRDKLQEWTDIADKKGVTDTGDSKAFNIARSKFSAFVGQAQNLVVCSAQQEKLCEGGNECDRAAKFYELVSPGRSAINDSIVDPPNPASDLDATTGYHKKMPATKPGSTPSGTKTSQ